MPKLDVFLWLTAKCYNEVFRSSRRRYSIRTPFLQKISRRLLLSFYKKILKNLKARIHSEIFLAKHFMKYVFHDSLFHRVNCREMSMIYFLRHFMKYQNSENRFSEFSLSWKTFLLNLFSCLINSFSINDVCKNLNENINILHVWRYSKTLIQRKHRKTKN